MFQKKFIFIFIIIIIIIFCLFKNYSIEQFVDKKCNIPVFYINLDRSKDRKLRLEKQLSKYFSNYNRIQAIDGNELIKSNLLKNKLVDNINYDLSNYNNHNYAGSKKNIIACLLSHIKSILKIHKSGVNYGIVMEDDVDFKHKSKWNVNIEEIVKNAPQDWEIIKLSTSNKNILENNISLYKKNINYVKFINESWCAAFYIINKKGIQKILEDIKDNTFKIDHKLYTNPAADFYIFQKTICYEYTKPLINLYEDKSLLETYEDLDTNINKIIDNFYKNN